MKHVVLSLGIGLVVFAGAERAAEACGGCFAPPETPTVVTDHRMVFSVSSQQSTLYDQIRYQGDPQSFAWVLPFSGEIETAVSSDQLFEALDSVTQTTVLPPPLNCPPLPDGCPRRRAGAAFDDESAQGSNGGVEVLKREVVGPYETVQLKATDPKSLDDWLTQNGYALPADVKPVVAAYQAEHFNFLALKLVPGKDVKDMRPVRVTTKGANVALPLRMVAAGTGATVGITLWVVAGGRYQPQNFGSFTIQASDLAWDWNQNKSNYVDVRAKKTNEGGRRVWEIESSTVVDRALVRSITGFDGYLAGDAGAGQEPAAKLAAFEEDIATLFDGIAPGTERVTRMRADLDRAALDHDLLVQASADQSVLALQRQVTAELNEPQCPVFVNCESNGTAPRSQAVALSTGSGGSGCATTTRSASPAWLAVLVGVVALTASRIVRRRR